MHHQLSCRFCLSPMSDQYIDIILGAVQKTNTSKISSQTGRLSTIYRGTKEDVMDALKACFIYAFRDGIHMTMEMTFSKGNRLAQQISSDNELVNASQINDTHFIVNCKMALYPLGVLAYKHYIKQIIDKAIEMDVHVESLEDVAVLKGDVHDLFNYFSWVNDYCLDNLDQYAFEVTLSVNSPTPE